MSKESIEFCCDVQKHIFAAIQCRGSDILLSMAKNHFSRPGKMLRPKLAYELGSALNSDLTSIALWAATSEMLHNATLIHDDLQDGDEYRRGQPTTWKTYGMDQAINLGDYLMLLAPSIFLESHLCDQTKLELSRLYLNMSTQIVCGQSMEPALKNLLNHPDIENEYLKCISNKTAALFSALAQGIAYIAGLPKIENETYARLFCEIGNLFQIQDDVLDLYGDKKRDFIGSDIKEGKVSYMVINHIGLFPDDKTRILEVLLKPRELTADQEVKELIYMFKEKGTLKHVLNNILDRKRNILENAPVATQSLIISLIDEILLPLKHLEVETGRLS